MIFGFSLLVWTHVLISLIAIGTGFVVVSGLLTARRMDKWTAWFLWTTLATSVSGFVIPADRFLPSHAVGIISVLVLAVAIPARYVRHMEGGWRRIYVLTAMLALYLNVFVLVAQFFAKVPALKAMAPTQSEPPFLIAQLAVLIVFGALTAKAVSRFQFPALRATA